MPGNKKSAPEMTGEERLAEMRRQIRCDFQQLLNEKEVSRIRKVVGTLGTSAPEEMSFGKPDNDTE